MTNSLANQTPKVTFGDLLHVSNGNEGVDETLRTVYDGNGNATCLEISETGAKFNGDLEVTGSLVGSTTLSDAAPENLGGAASGSSNSASRADHVHFHGNLAGGSLHSAASTSVAGFMSSADKTKLDGVASGATANATDAQLRDRSTHTGVQAISTVTGLQTALDGKLATNGDGSAVTVTPTGGYSTATLAALTGAGQTLARRSVIMARTTNSGTDPSANPATWKILKPDGAFLDATGTTSQGFQEALNYAVSNGFNFVVDGGAVGGAAPSGVDGAVIQCNAPITFPPIQKGCVSIRGVTLNFGGSPSGSPFAVTIDSCMMARIEWPGSQVVAYNSAYGGAVCLKPTSELPQDGAGPVITDSIIEVPTTVAYPGKVCVRLDAGTYGIGSNDLRIMEPNGGATGVEVVAGTGAGACYGNRVKIIDAHAQSGTSVSVGTGTTGAANIFGNRWDIECDPGTGATGVVICGTKDIYTVSVSNNEGSTAKGLDLKSSAAGNQITILKNDGATPISDASSGANVIFSAGAIDGAAIGATSPKTGKFTTVTATGLTFGSETLSAYETNTWTPSLSGSSVAGAQTYATRSGTYERIGNQVTITARIEISAKDAAIAGSAIISGLPFVAVGGSNDCSLSVSRTYGITYGAGRTELVARVNPGTSDVSLETIGSGVSFAAVDVSGIAASAGIVVTGTYFI